MAFTLQEIEHVFSEQKLIYATNESKLAFQQTQLYKTVCDFLTGKTAQLPVDVEVGYEYICGTFVFLLKDIAHPDANDKLIEDLIFHKDFRGVTNYSLTIYLFKYLKELVSAHQLQIAGQWNSRRGGTNDDFVKLCLQTLRFTEWKASGKLFPNEFVENFLTQKILAAKAFISLIYNNWWTYYNQGEGNLAYLILLDKIRPEYAVLLVKEIMQQQGGDIPLLQFIAEYKEGVYLEKAINEMADEFAGANNWEDRRSCSNILQVYEYYPEKFIGAALLVSKKYLDYLIRSGKKEGWEFGYYCTDRGVFPFKRTLFSAISIFLLFKTSGDDALQYVQQMKDAKIPLHADVLSTLHQNIGEVVFSHFEFSMQAEGAGIDHYRSVLQLFESSFPKEKQIPVYWGLLKHKSKAFKQLIATTITRIDPEAEQKAIEMLDHKSGEVRQTAAQILNITGGEEAIKAIHLALNKETNDTARDTLLQTIADQLPKETSYEYVAEMVAAAKQRGKLDKTADSWLSAEAFPALYYLNGEKLSVDEIQFLLYRMGRVKEMRSETEARYMIRLIDRLRGGDFALALIKTYVDKDAKPEHKYLMTLAALVGNDSVVDKIRITTNRWIEESRYKMAEYGVGALALQGSNKALRWVEWYSRKYRTKKANVGTAALAALESAAEELGISTHELGDRIVPDFGFDGLFKNFTASGENYRVFIDSNFKLAFFNEDNKKLKAVPPSADADLKEELKAIAKEVKDITRSQSSRLEYYLIIQRKWNFAQWQQAFLQNPVMFIYATRILWGRYDNNGNLMEAFYCNEDTSILNIESDEIELNDEDNIGIVHPLQLDADQLKQWQQHFYDAAIEPIFPQLDRQLVSLDEIDLTRKIIFKYDGRQMQVGSIRSTLERYGWGKGPVGDGGILESFKLAYPEKCIEVTLDVEGVGAGYGWGMDEKLGRLYAADLSKLKGRWYSPGDEQDEALVAFNTLPSIFLNEMFSAIERIKPYTEQKAAQ